MVEKKVIIGGYTMGNTKVDERRYIVRFTILQEEMEYHICLVLGIDIEEKVRQSLSSHHSWKQLEKAQLSELKVNKNLETERS